MQDEVREATKYDITLQRNDGKPLGKSKSGKTLYRVSVSFRSDKYLSNEYLGNLKKALSSVDTKELNKMLTARKEEN